MGTTSDTQTPYRSSVSLARQLGGPLLTMRGVDHVAYPGASACVDATVNRYLLDLVVPPRRSTCAQDVPATAAVTG